MEHISEVVSAAAAAMLVGLVAVLVRRRREHLRLVVRVLNEPDRQMLSYLDRLTQSGQLVPAAAN